jgi:hypothetical protein
MGFSELVEDGRHRGDEVGVLVGRKLENLAALAFNDAAGAVRLLDGKIAL